MPLPGRAQIYKSKPIFSCINFQKARLTVSAAHRVLESRSFPSSPLLTENWTRCCPVMAFTASIWQPVWRGHFTRGEADGSEQLQTENYCTQININWWNETSRALVRVNHTLLPLDCVAKVHKIMGKGDVVGVNYLPFQRAFDRLLHWRLSKGTNNHRIKSNVMLRIKSQLNNRKQTVITNVLFLIIKRS